MLQNQLQNGSPIGCRRTPPSPLHVEAEIAVSAFEEENPDLPLPPTLGVEMGWQVVGGVDPQLESIDFECFDFSQRRLWISRHRKRSADRTFCQSLANERCPVTGKRTLNRHPTRRVAGCRFGFVVLGLNRRRQDVGETRIS